MTWWYWLVLGLVLIALEMVSAGGFYIILSAPIIVGLAPHCNVTKARSE